jgi:hypothetical protein
MERTIASSTRTATFWILLASLPLLWGGGCKSGEAKSPYAATDVVWMSMSYPITMDASVPITAVKVDYSGNASCTKRGSSGDRWRGQLPAADSTIPDLLSRPGVVRDLATPCYLSVDHPGPYISTHLASDDDQTVHSRLVMESCSNANLEALVQALARIGDACIASAIVDPPDGGPG